MRYEIEKSWTRSAGVRSSYKIIIFCIEIDHRDVAIVIAYCRVPQKPILYLQHCYYKKFSRLVFDKNDRYLLTYVHLQLLSFVVTSDRGKWLYVTRYIPSPTRRF